MSKVIRLSDSIIKSLEEYREISIKQAEIICKDFPNHKREIEKLRNLSIEDLLFDCVNSSIYWNEDNLNKMK